MHGPISALMTLFMLTALLGCSGRVQQQQVAINPVMTTDPAFESAVHLGAGFDLVADGGIGWAPGDQVLYGLLLKTPTRTHCWYMRVTVMGPDTFIEGIRTTELPLSPTHWFRPVRVVKDDGEEIDHTVYLDEFTQVWPLQFELFNDQATLLETSVTLTTPEYLMRDLHQYAIPDGPIAPQRQLQWSQNGRTMTDLDAEIRQQMRQVSQVIASLHTIAMTYVSAEAIKDVRKKAGAAVIKGPGILDLPWITTIMREGAAMLIEPDFENAQPVEIDWLEPIGETHGFAIDVNVEVQERQVMRLNVVVVPPVRPLEGTAGIAELRAWHLENPNRIFLMQLLGAQSAEAKPIELAPPGNLDQTTN